MENSYSKKIWDFIIKYKYLIAGIFIVLLAALLRYSGYNWDDLHSFHPDERAISYAGERIDFLKLKLDPEFYAYGTLPIYIVKIVNLILSKINTIWSDHSHYILIGRFVSATVGTLAVLIVFLIARKLYDNTTAVCSSLFLALTVSHIQDSHFATVDIMLSFFIALIIYLLIDIFYGKATYKRYIVVSIVIGLALAVKVSTLPILVVFFICHVFNLLRKDELFKLNHWLIFFGCCLLIIGVNFIAQPYAYIHHHEFIERIQSELRIAKTADVCYDQQYVGTPFLLYHLKELVYRSMGPPLGILCIISFVIATITTILHPFKSKHFLPLLWALPYFAIINTYEVKYIRYMEPLFPFFCLFAGYYFIKAIRLLTTTKTQKVLATTLGLIVIGYTLFYALAFSSMYMKTHSVVAASKWFYNNVPENAYILGQHWDEGFPLNLRKTKRKDYKIVSLELYEHFGSETENRKKAEYLANYLVKGDYIIAQTRRLYGATANVKEKYPITTKYFDLLFTDRLGFKLVKEVNSYPKLLGIEFNDDLSDESFSVYDHPKVLIFKKIKQFDKEKYLELLESDEKLLLDKNGMLSVHQKDPLKVPEYSIIDEVFIVIAWIILLEVFAIIGMVLANILFKKGKASSIFLYQLLGVLAFSYVIWILSYLNIIKYTSIPILAIFIAAIALSIIYIIKNKKEIITDLKNNIDQICLSKLTFITCIIIFLLIRSLSPEIYWGEKPMDYGFLNNLIRVNTLPADEIWYAGNPLNYFYFGHFMFATLAKLTHIPSYFVYNMALATVGAFAFNGAFSVLFLLSRSHIASLLGGIFTVFWANLSGIREYLYNDNPINFHFFWATSRVIPRTVNEYPLWGITFGDLHAHICVMPIFILLIYLGVYLFKSIIESDKSIWLTYLTASLVLGSISVTSSWDSPNACFMLFTCITLGLYALFKSSKSDFGIKKICFNYLLLGATVGLSFVWFLPYWITTKSAHATRLGQINIDEYIKLNDFVMVWGFFLFIFLCFFIYEIFIHINKNYIKDSKKSLIIILLITGIFSAIILNMPEKEVTQTTTFTIIFILLGITTLFIQKDPIKQLICGLITLGLLIALFIENYFFIDHMNTVFKFFLNIWYLFAITGAYTLYYLFKTLISAFKENNKIYIKLLKSIWVIPLLALILLSIFTSYTVIAGFKHSDHINTYKPTQTINGLEYLKYNNPKEFLAIDWINKNIKGPATMLEAQVRDGAYNKFGRIVMKTGMPTLVGWEHHLIQRGIKRKNLEKRYKDVKTIYSTEDANKAYKLLKNYNINYVYVGVIEINTYGFQGLKKFEENKDKFKEVYSNPYVRIFKVL